MTGWLRAWKWRRRVRANLREVERRQVTPRPHGLDAPLIVSLTSFPPRFPQLAHTLRCLTRQTVAPDEVVLWCAREDLPALPAEIGAMKGLRIAACDDLRSYTKLVPALLEDPGRHIVTADDDLHYPADWLETLVAAAKTHPGRTIAHRAHRVLRDPGGSLAPYADWPKNIPGPQEGPDVFATGCGGVLYPPGALHESTTDADRFMALSPTADDVWFYWMARLQGTPVRSVGPRMRLVEWPGTQEVSLLSVNAGTEGADGNDRAIAALTAEFGSPLGPP